MLTQEVQRLLVVDDEEPNRDLLSRRLKKAGFEVECAASAREALAVLQREAIDLVLLDNMMPEMSGIDLLKLLRATQATTDLPVIMVTALNDSSRVVEALSTGANDYVTKPIDFPVALARVEAQLQRRRADKLIRKSAERLALASSGANEGIFDWDLDRNEVFVSESWKQLSGLRQWNGNQVEGWIDSLHPKDAVALRSQVARWKDGDGPGRVEMEQRIRQSDGSWRWIEVKATLQRNAAGVACRLVGSIADVTRNRTCDPLTSLGNRNHLLCVLEEAGIGSSILLISLDRYKVVQDNLGPAAAESLIASSAIRLRQELESSQTREDRSKPLLFRLDAEQFAILLEADWPAESVESLASRLIVVMEKPLEIEGRSLFTSANAGLTTVSSIGRASEQILQDATSALGQAKLLGRGRLVCFNETLRDNAIQKMELENDLREALGRSEFLVYYQPKIELSTGRLRGFEALLRWNHPTRGLVPPDTFIPLAEQSGLMIPLGDWVLREACRTMQRWRELFPQMQHLVISVNVSAFQVKDGNMVERVRQILDETGLSANSLHLEVTESAFIADTKETMRVFDQIKKLGVELNLDDFGTGYSSLQYLSDMRFDALKIDKSFLKNLVVDDQASELVKSMLGMARSLDMDVVAEGVETVAQMERLQLLGCKYGQGFLFSRPVPEQQALEILRRDASSDAVQS